jgi:clathrin interactor 1
VSLARISNHIIKNNLFHLNILRRYRDNERTSPDVVTSAPTFKADDNKKPISVKATTAKPLSTVSSGVRGAKKIDMGAAFNYGKPGDLGINSPTHRNTHNEDLFGSSPVKSTAAMSKNDIIEDIFSSSTVASSSDPTDDFDPRAGEKQADFGDFASAFGSSNAPSIVPAVAATPRPPSGEFADFSAFSAQPVATQPPLPDDNFLFNATPAPTQSNNSSLLGNADLFGNSVITSAFTSPVGGNKDLLSDFGDLTLNSVQGEHSVTSI